MIMKATRRLAVLLLALSLLITSIASCDMLGSGAELDGEKIMRDAEAALDVTPYTATVSTIMSSKDSEFQDRVDSISDSVATISFDEDDFKLRSEVVVDDVSIVTICTAIDGRIYVERTASVGEVSATEKRSASIKADEVDALLAELGAGAAISYDDFTVFMAEGTEDDATVSCTEPKEGVLSDAEAVLASSFGDDASLMLKDLYLLASVEGGKITASTLTYVFTLGMGTEMFTVQASVITEYSYGNTVIISAPLDADEYKTVSLENLFG